MWLPALRQAQEVQRDQDAASESDRHDHDRQQWDHAQQGGREPKADGERPTALQHCGSIAKADAAPVERNRDDLQRHEPPAFCHGCDGESAAT